MSLSRKELHVTAVATPLTVDRGMQTIIESFRGLSGWRAQIVSELDRLVHVQTGLLARLRPFHAMIEPPTVTRPPSEAAN